MAWKAFTPAGRLMPSSNRDRLVDVCEELVKFSAILLPRGDFLVDRWSERKERREKGRLQSQAEKEAEKDRLAREKTSNKLPEVVVEDEQNGKKLIAAGSSATPA